jgi:hypothetical protein
VVVHKTSWKTAAAEEILAKTSSRIPTFARYCLDVLTGNIPAARLVFLAVERHLNDLQRWQGPAGSQPYYFDQNAAAKIIKFARDCAPFKLDPFQQFIVGSLFGWKSADGFRRFRNAYVEIGKGNGKSPLAGGSLASSDSCSTENLMRKSTALPQPRSRQGSHFAMR